MNSMLSVAAFAELCHVSRVAIYQASYAGKLRIFQGPNGREIDPNSREAIDYRVNISRQRHQAGLVTAGRRTLHRHSRSAPDQRIEQEEDPCRVIEQCWKAGGLPSGWSALCLRDVPDFDTPGMETPLFFYAPNGGKENPLFESDAAAAYEVDLEADPAVAIAKDDTRHPLILLTFGRISWLDHAKAGKVASA